MLGFMVFAAYQTRVLDETRFWAPSLAVAATLIAIMVLDWERVLRSALGEILLGLAATVLIASMAVVSTLPELQEFVFILYFGVVAFTAALGGRLLHWSATAILIVTNLVMPFAFGGGGPSIEDAILQSGTLIIVAIVTGIVATEFRNETYVSRVRLAEIRRREEDVKRLYEVSRTMAIGSSLSDVLPSLVGKIGTYLDAHVGVVLLHDDIEGTLDVVSPIWTSGHELDVGTYRVSLRQRGELASLFLARQPRLYANIGAIAGQYGLLGELGVDSAIAVPLIVERRAIGVLVIADKTGGPFTDDDLQALESLAAPAALVLSQLERYEAAAGASRRMEELAQMKTDFVSVVSHELRTPLTSILGSLATMGRPELAPSEPAARELLVSAQKQSERLRRLIEDLLMVSRIDNAALPQHPELIRLETFVNETVAGIPGSARVAAVEVQPGLLIEADPDHIGRLIRNLVENSLKYAPSSDIEIFATQARGRIQFVVSDHGPGIPADQRDTVFERFSQIAPSETRAHGGSGLGLSIVKSLVTSMGGTIELSDTPGGGATFTVMLPVRPGVTRQTVTPA